MGIIKITNMSFYGYHGVTAAEKELIKRFTVDVEMAVDTKLAADTDNLENTVDYEAVYHAVGDFVANNTFHLTETVAEGIADLVEKRFAQKGVRVRVRKNNPPFAGHLDYVEIEVSHGEI